REQDQRDALERVIGARRRAALGGLRFRRLHLLELGSYDGLLLRQRQWCTVEPCGCGGWRGHGKSRAEIFESSEAPKKAKRAAATTPDSGMPICTEGAQAYLFETFC